MLLYLTRFTEQGHERYYKMLSSQNLFGEHLVIREFGNTNYKKPTRIIEKQFDTQKDAEKFFGIVKSQKLHRGYFTKCA